MRTKSTPRKSCLVQPYTLPKKEVPPKKVMIGKTEVREAPNTGLAKARARVTLVATPDMILSAIPQGLKVSARAMLSGGLGLGIVLAKTDTETGFFTYCFGKKTNNAITVKVVDRSILAAALDIVGVNYKAFEKYEKVASDDLQDRRE